VRCFEPIDLSFLVDANDDERVNDSGHKSQQRQQDVDEQLHMTSQLESDTEGWKNDGQNNAAAVDGRFAALRVVLGQRLGFVYFGGLGLYVVGIRGHGCGS